MSAVVSRGVAAGAVLTAGRSWREHGRPAIHIGHRMVALVVHYAGWKCGAATARWRPHAHLSDFAPRVMVHAERAALIEDLTHLEDEQWETPATPTPA